MRKQGCKKWALYVPQLVALLLVFNLNLNATAFSQHQRLNLKLKDATLEEFISAIKRQCDVGFIYDYNKTKDLKGITVTAVNEEISAVLEQALRVKNLALLPKFHALAFFLLSLWGLMAMVERFFVTMRA